MKHNIRINRKVQEIDCLLGSGIKDKNGKEIFEGDKVKVGNHGVRVVHFSEGVFTLGDVLYIAQAELENNLEIVGHIAQD